jgi:hypothetical protein
VDPSLLRPRRAWYWVAGAPAGVGLAAAIALVVTSIFVPLLSDLTPLRAPGEVTIDLDEGAGRTIYRQTQESGKRLELPGGARIECDVTGPGGAVTLGDANLSLDKGGDSYAALFDFDAPESGSYRVRCEDQTQPDRSVSLAIGESVDFLGLLGALGAFAAGVVPALAIATITAVRRDSHKRRLRQELAQRQAGVG